MKQKITDYLDEIYGGTFTATHLQKLVTRLESAKRLITQRRKKHWDESDVVLITYADQFHSNDLKPLPTFNQFYPQWLQRIFSHVHLLPFYPWSLYRYLFYLSTYPYLFRARPTKIFRRSIPKRRRKNTLRSFENWEKP